MLITTFKKQRTIGGIYEQENTITLLIIFISIPKTIMAIALGNIYNISPREICSYEKSTATPLTQGAYFFDHYVVLAGFRSDDKPIVLTLIDLNTCTILDQDETTIMHHANDITYNPNTNRYYVAGGLKEIYSFSIVNNEIVVDSNVITAARNTISLDYATDKNVYYARYDNQLWELPNLTSKGTRITTFPIVYDNFDDGTLTLTKQTFSYYKGNVYYIRTQDKSASSVYNYGFLSAYDASTGTYKYTIQIPQSTFNGHLEAATIRNNKIYLAYNVHYTTPKKMVFLEYTGIDEIENQYNAIIKSSELIKSGDIVIIWGQQFDYSKLRIKQTHNDNSISYVSLNGNNCQINGFNNTIVGIQTINLIYNKVEYPVTITIKAKSEISSSLIYSGPKDIELNQNLDITKFKINIKYDNGTEENITLNNSNARIESYDKTKPGEQRVRIIYKQKQYPVTINVLNKKEVSRELLGNKKIEVFKDNNIDLSKYSIIIKYNDNSQKEIKLSANNATIKNYDKSKAGKQKIYIIYDQKSYPLEVNVIAIKEVSRELISNGKIEVFEGDKIDLSNYTIIINYNNGTKKEVTLTTNNTNIENYDSSKIGKQKIDLIHDKKRYTVEINVLERVEASRTLITKEPLELYEDEQLDISKFYILVNYTNNTQKEIQLNSNDITIKEYNKDQLGKQTIIIEYENKEYTYEITILKREELSRELITKGHTTILKNGQLDLNNYYILIKYANNTQKEVQLDKTNTIVEGFNNTIIGEQTVKLIYEHQEYQATITIKDIEQEKQEEPKKHSNISIILITIICSVLAVITVVKTIKRTRKE